MAEAPKGRQIITVRAKKPGTAVDVQSGRTLFRDKHAVFQVFADAYVADWMDKAVGDTPPPPAPEPPPTTLPAHLQPRPIH